MRIVVLQGSPNLKGSTSLMVESFKKGAEEVGNEVIVIDLAKKKINPCHGCIACGYKGPCVQKDDVLEIRRTILESDALIFATPLYYYGFSSQLKMMIDRFCAFNSSLTRKGMKSALLTVAWNTQDWTFEALVSHYKTLVRYLDFDDQGMVLGYGCGTPSMTRGSSHIEEAYQLGRKFR